MKKLLALLLVIVMVAALMSGCNESGNDSTEPSGTSDTTEGTDGTEDATDPVETEPERGAIEDYEYGTDYISLYEQFGDDVTIDMVEEHDGLAYITMDGEQYELGMDFLSMAMVYNTTPIEGNEDFDTAEKIYNEWWKLYIQRWNYLVPEVPLYSNQYYHVYNAKMQNYEVNPYWGASQAIVDVTIDTSKGENSVVMGSATDLTGSFRYASFGVSNPSASDLDITNMTGGLTLSTTTATKEGTYAWNPTVVESHEAVTNEDGSETFTIKIYEDMQFSDGSPITAKNYLAFVMAFSTPVAAEAATRDHHAGMNLAGYADFAAYTGPEDGVGNKVFTGLHLIDEYTFSVTIDAEYLPYYYDIVYASFGPDYLPLWLGDCDILDDGEGCYLSDEFYAKNDDGSYVMAEHIRNSRNDISTYPYPGPYVVSDYDASELTATLTINPYFKGNYEGTKPSVEVVSYVKVVSETQNEWLTTGRIDLLQDITGGSETAEALALVEANPDQFASTYYDRAGYGKLDFRCDFGPASFPEVRRAIAYSIDRNAFAQEFTGGYGTVVHGPYYMGSAAYMANQDTILLDQYAVSEASAIAELEAGGWIYNAEGGEYTEGVRYKKLSSADLSDANVNYSSQDGAYKTVEVNGEYYMPLVVNWFCTEDNEVSEQLKTAWANSSVVSEMGMVVQWTQGTWDAMQGERYQLADYGYQGPPMYTAFNFATGFTSAVFDYSYNWTIDPSMYDDYTISYLKDEADFYWLDA